MNIYKLIHPETSENEYRVELEINVIVTPPDPNNDASDWDYLGMTELVDFGINSVEIRTGIENIQKPRQKKDWLSYNWTEVQMVDLSPEEQEELNAEINKELMNECNC